MRILIILIVTTVNAFAQIDTTKTKTLFGNRKSNAVKKINYLGIYLAPEVQYGSLAKEYTTFSGASAMLVFNKKWAIGLAGYMSDRRNTNTTLSANKSLGINAGFGGFKLEYTPKVTSVIHISFPLLIGGGMASIDSINVTNNQFGNTRYFGKNYGPHNRNMEENFGRRGESRGSDFFVLQPGVNIEANIFKFAKVFVGANYRIAASVNSENHKTTTISTLPTPTASQLSGLSVNAGIKIGIFDYQLNKKRGFKLFGNRSHKNRSKN